MSPLQSQNSTAITPAQTALGSLDNESFTPEKKQHFFLRTIGSTLTRAKNSAAKTLADTGSKLAEVQKSYEGKLDTALNNHREAVGSAFEKASTAASNIGKKFEAVATNVAEEASTGVDTLRKSAAYKAALDEATVQLSAGLQLSPNLSKEQREALSELAKKDLETIRENVAQRFDTLLADNTSLDFSRSRVRQYMPEIMAAGVNEVSKLTKDLQATSAAIAMEKRVGGIGSSSVDVEKIYNLNRGKATLPDEDRSRAVSAIGGQFNPSVQAPPVAAKIREQEPTRELAAVKSALSVASSSLSVSEPVKSLSVATESVATETKIDQEGLVTALESKKALELKSIAASIGAGNQELSIAGASRMKKADLVDALNEPARQAAVLAALSNLANQSTESSSVRAAAAPKQKLAMLTTIKNG